MVMIKGMALGYAPFFYQPRGEDMEKLRFNHFFPILFVPDKTKVYFARNKIINNMINIKDISFEIVDSRYGYEYTLTEEGRAMLPPDIKPIGEGEKSWVFSGWDFIPFLLSHLQMVKQIVSYTTPGEYYTYFSVEEGDILEEYIPPFTITDIDNLCIFCIIEPFFDSLNFTEQRRAWVKVLLKKMQEWGILDEYYCFVPYNPITGKKRRNYEKGLIMKTLCKTIKMKQTEWNAIGWMLLGKGKEEWDENDKKKLESIRAGTRKWEAENESKYKPLDPVIKKLCDRIKKFDTSLGKTPIFTANSSKRNFLN